jgi:hypothetical protein
MAGWSAMAETKFEVKRYSLTFRDSHPFLQRDVCRQLDADGALAAECFVQCTFRTHFGLRPSTLR